MDAKERNGSEEKPFKAAVITVSDKGARGERVDESGPAAKEMLAQAGYEVVETLIIPDEPEELKTELIRLADEVRGRSGGYKRRLQDFPCGIRLRRRLWQWQRLAPGIAEAIRYQSMAVTNRAMLSRGVSVIRRQTVIVNLPGSPKAVKESLGYILDSLGQRDSDFKRQCLRMCQIRPMGMSK